MFNITLAIDDPDLFSHIRHAACYECPHLDKKCTNDLFFFDSNICDTVPNICDNVSRYIIDFLQFSLMNGSFQFFCAEYDVLSFCDYDVSLDGIDIKSFIHNLSSSLCSSTSSFEEGSKET